MTELIKQLIKNIENIYKIYEVNFYIVKENNMLRWFVDSDGKKAGGKGIRLNYKKIFNKKELAEKYKKEMEDCLSKIHLSEMKPREKSGCIIEYIVIKIEEKKEEKIDKKKDFENMNLEDLIGLVRTTIFAGQHSFTRFDVRDDFQKFS